jgi:hypothetical protein
MARIGLPDSVLAHQPAGAREKYLAILILRAGAFVAMDAEGIVQETGGAADLPVWSGLTQVQVNSACPLFSTPRRAPAGLTWFLGRPVSKLIPLVGCQPSIDRLEYRL